MMMTFAIHNDDDDNVDDNNDDVDGNVAVDVDAFCFPCLKNGKNL